ncbi:MAG TPA: hypothetical protein VNO21_16160 [Polyangiaceae bacterium]|nr:hypothetical protein [Polyangiaceae bacterium]
MYGIVIQIVFGIDGERAHDVIGSIQAVGAKWIEAPHLATVLQVDDMHRAAEARDEERATSERRLKYLLERLATECGERFPIAGVRPPLGESPAVIVIGDQVPMNMLVVLHAARRRLTRSGRVARNVRAAFAQHEKLIAARQGHRIVDQQAAATSVGDLLRDEGIINGRRNPSP